jgi:hypothetical protein
MTEAVAFVVPSAGMLPGDTMRAMFAGGPAAFAACGSANHTAIAAKKTTRIADRVAKLHNHQFAVGAFRRFLVLTSLHP